MLWEPVDFLQWSSGRRDSGSPAPLPQPTRATATKVQKALHPLASTASSDELRAVGVPALPPLRHNRPTDKTGSEQRLISTGVTLA